MASYDRRRQEAVALIRERRSEAAESKAKESALKRAHDLAVEKMREEGMMKRHAAELAQGKELAKPQAAYWESKAAGEKRLLERDLRESGPAPREIEMDESGYLPTIRNVPTEESTPAPTVAAPGTQDFVGPMQRSRSGSTGSIDEASGVFYSKPLPEIPYSVRRKAAPNYQIPFRDIYEGLSPIFKDIYSGLIEKPYEFLKGMARP